MHLSIFAVVLLIINNLTWYIVTVDINKYKNQVDKVIIECEKEYVSCDYIITAKPVLINTDINIKRVM